MTRDEINKKYAIDAAQDSYEVWAWTDGSKTPMKFKYAKKNVDKNFIIEKAKKMSGGKDIKIAWLMNNGKQFLRVK